MKNSKLISAAVAVSAILGIGAASAADLPVKAPPIVATAPSWTGFYGGVNAGWGWSKADYVATPFGTSAIADMPVQASGNQANGALFGGQVGYNWQIRNWLLGIEGDISGAGINGSGTTNVPSIIVPPLSNDGTMASVNVQWLASIRGRVGALVGSGLLYATGGAAWEGVQTTAFATAETAPAVFGQTATGRFSTTKSGWVAGVGYEWMIAPKWTVRAEYLHYGFGNGPNAALPYNGGNPPAGCAIPGCGANIATGNTNVDVVRVGVNYVFNAAGPVVAKY
jgi:outer membrane immunogenic protein